VGRNRREKAQKTQKKNCFHAFILTLIAMNLTGKFKITGLILSCKCVTPNGVEIGLRNETIFCQSLQTLRVNPVRLAFPEDNDRSAYIFGNLAQAGIEPFIIVRTAPNHNLRLRVVTRIEPDAAEVAESFSAGGLRFSAFIFVGGSGFFDR
jgi:hypothetical protein